MKVKPIDVALASCLQKKRYFENYRKIGKKVKEIASKILKDKKLRVNNFWKCCERRFYSFERFGYADYKR